MGNKKNNKDIKYDFIIVLNADIFSNNDLMVFPNIKEGKYLGGQVRMEAAVKIFQENKKSVFILVGGYNEDDGNESYRKSKKTEDMGKFLTKKCSGIKLCQIPSLPCTKHNLVVILNTKKEELKTRKIALLTNKYHLPRARLFWDQLVSEEFYDVPRPEFLSAESYSDWEGRFNFRNEYKERLLDEIKGLVDIKNNSYEDSCVSKKLPKFVRILNEKKNILLTLNEQKDYEKKLGKIEKNKKTLNNLEAILEHIEDENQMLC